MKTCLYILSLFLTTSVWAQDSIPWMQVNHQGGLLFPFPQDHLHDSTAVMDFDLYEVFTDHALLQISVLNKLEVPPGTDMNKPEDLESFYKGLLARKSQSYGLVPSVSEKTRIDGLDAYYMAGSFVVEGDTFGFKEWVVYKAPYMINFYSDYEWKDSLYATMEALKVKNGIRFIEKTVAAEEKKEEKSTVYRLLTNPFIIGGLIVVLGIGFLYYFSRKKKQNPNS